MASHLEKLSADILDEDFKRIFKPIHLLQTVVGNLKVKIEHGFVTPPSKWYNLFIVDSESLCDFYVKLQRIDRDLNTKAYSNSVLSWLSFLSAVAIAMITNSETYFVLIELSFDYSLLYFLLCIFTELITSKLDKSKKLCLDIVHSSEGAIKRNAKRMLLLLDVKNDISLYDIYTLNARLLVRTLGVVTTYTIIILQFYV
ncbi:uncharacterized protein LOC124544262 [Vanessa cardui]|uniref:uncharacterized protein LOC124544262 n=1 Tax=Vanessa cardui TaxID=171605 RepID=UPI001F13D16C|nr:uncharacterized protein LOC124544262 [Vanessa cardui]